MRKRIMAGVPVGLLAYSGNAVVGWCSVAPRETYRGLGGDENIENVWSIACFFIIKEFRNRGIVSTMIEAAKAYAKDNGAKNLEAYPVDPDSPSYRFMGFVNTFVDVGFCYVKSAGKRRKVMIFQL